MIIQISNASSRALNTVRHHLPVRVFENSCAGIARDSLVDRRTAGRCSLWGRAGCHATVYNVRTPAGSAPPMFWPSYKTSACNPFCVCVCICVSVSVCVQRRRRRRGRRVEAATDCVRDETTSLCYCSCFCCAFLSCDTQYMRMYMFGMCSVCVSSVVVCACLCVCLAAAAAQFRKIK